MLWIMEGCYLAVCAGSDIKTGMISVRWSCLIIITAAALRLTYYEISVGQLMTDLFFGIVCLLLSWLSHGTVGMGDGLMMLASGVVIGREDTLRLLWMALLLAAGLGGIFLLFKKKTKEDLLPFAPCMSASYLLLSLRQFMGK